MYKLDFRASSPRKQYFICLAFVLAVGALCYLFSDFLPYRVVALILLVSVSLTAMVFEIMPVLSGAILSALLWNFFFIPPKFTLAISNAEDALVFLMYFVIAMINAVLTARIRRAEQIARQKQEHENTLKLYNTLLNSLSHELRTPISTIIAASDNLQAMADKLSEYDKYELVSEISKASLQLNRQVGNLLNMSRLESGFVRPKYDWVDMNELIYDVIAQLEDVAKSKPINVVVKESMPLVKLDYGLFSQVLHNLLHNALTYIPKYAIITVRAGIKDHKLRVVVEDTGNGFPPAEIEQVFDKFYRLKNTATGGSGLGLSIVKGFTEAMNGTVHLNNMSEGGAVFTVEIPCEISDISTLAKK